MIVAFLCVCQAGRRLGLKEDLLRTNLDKMEALLPELTPDVNKMRAADWVGAGAGVGQQGIWVQLQVQGGFLG